MRQLIVPLLLTCAPLALAQTALTPLDHVKPLIGTGGHGHTFPGACVPNGLVQLSPDTRPDGYNDWDGCSGYHYSDSLIHGFSHTHLSGTGVADLCDVLIMPVSGPHQAGTAAPPSLFSHVTEHTGAGRYSVYLEGPRTHVDLTTSPRVGVHRYRMPMDRERHLVVDLTHRDKLLHTEMQRKGNALVGERRSSSWAKDQRLFFHLEVGSPKGPVEWELLPGSTAERATLRIPATAPEEIIVKVAISAVDAAGAAANMRAEVAHWDIDKVRKAAADAWAAKLDKIRLKGGTEEQRNIFYTALYHCYVAPSVFNDTDGRYRGMDGNVHHADHPVYTIFSLWDTFRALHPLMTILEPEMTNDWIRTFLLHYQQSGRLPVWELWGNETDCMIGYHSVSVIADAYLKGIRGYDAELALKAMVASAMRDEPGLNAYRSQGYISSEDAPESVSKTLEYAYDDWCIARMAEAMGKDSLANAFYARSRNWQNLFDPSTRFFRARQNGGFNAPFDPYEVNFNYTEANAWQYSLFVPHDLIAFQQLWGSGFYAHLNELFTTRTATTGRQQADITGLIGQYAHGNEPSHHMAYLYRNRRGNELLERILREQYNDRPDGLSGNEDCGQMSAWYVMSAMGIYPVAPGMDRYWTGVTLFDEVEVHQPNGARFTVVRGQAEDAAKRGNKASGAQPWPSIPHALIKEGGRLDIAQGPVADKGRSRAQFKEDLVVLPAAIINAPARTFREPMEVTVSCIPGPWSLVLMQPDGRAVPARNDPHQLTFTVSSSGTWSAYTEDEKGQRGPLISARYTKLEGNVTVRLETPFAPQYSAGGDQALVDGLRGGNEYRTGEWQGFEGVDLSAAVDLGEMRTVGRIGLSVLQDQNAWIWYPQRVTIAWSTNGRMWESAVVDNTVPRTADGAQHQELWTPVLNKKARYITVVADNAGPCPDWHPGKGGKTWIFADEVLLELK